MFINIIQRVILETKIQNTQTYLVGEGKASYLFIKHISYQKGNTRSPHKQKEEVVKNKSSCRNA